MAKRRQLTDADIKQIEGMSAIRLPMDQIAHLLGMSESVLAEAIKRSKSARQALDRGRANASAKFRSTLYRTALGEIDREQVTIEVDSETGKELSRTVKIVPTKNKPNDRMMELWARTQEGFKMTDRHELVGPRGGPILTATLTKEQLALQLKQFRELDED